MTNKIRIKLSAYDLDPLDRSAQKILKTVRSTGEVTSGPILMPTKKRKYTVLRSPHIDKKSREQFEQRKHKRIIDIHSSSSKPIESLMKLEISPGIQVSIEV